MNHPNRRGVVIGAAAAAASIALPGLARAQAFPSKPIKVICPWPAGGSTDAVMRALAESAGKILGQQVIIENKPGAGGMLGPNELVKAAPDGYTLSQVPHGVFRIPHMQKTVFDTLTDFTWIVCLTGYTFGLVVPADSPIKSVKDFVDYAKANPGKLRLLATYGSKRTKRWPNVPTLDELGYKTVSDSPFGVCGPKGMDPAVTRALHDAFKKTLDDPAVLATFDKFDQSVIYMDTDTYTRWARETFAAEKATIERLGMAGKS